ncbi:MAG: sugar phosphate isomerase/epimerase family protein [Dissulfurimicrobium sp.]|uniref:sugar phosphate isomerase/epimerase family protein n=1 Tax=Dissulfurimicrobium TaxID=1769732 RepID=UPI001EDC4F8C|nr:sugar phosphate isomerase/epimerase family protein [Dissulfurimicrobium hydrothermale]UKL14051.1 sugar phosphate isomerase/epimerase [Dissulfurimicrobium hydrothermale]
MEAELAKKNAFVCCPFNLIVSDYLKRIIAEHINPEIGLNGGVLDEFRFQSFRRIARIFKASGTKCTIHAQFTDLSIGAIDKKIRRVSVDRLRQCLEIAAIYEARSMVFHTGFDERHYLSFEGRWMENARASLETLCREAESAGIPIMLENVFEPSPAIHKALFSAADSPALKFCFDMGHQQVFSKTGLSIWLDELGRYIGQLHLHDNLGRKDDHLAIGAGILDFDALFSFLTAHKIHPLLTLEPHGEEQVMPTLRGLGGLLKRFPILTED